MSDNIIFKASKNKLTAIFYGREKDFNKVKNSFCSKLNQVGYDSFESGKLSLEIKGHYLSSEQKKKLMDIFYDRKDSLDSDAVPEKASDLKENDVDKSEIKNQDMKSFVYKNSLRSGQFIKYDGNVIIVGDVNPGAEVIATGNIIVMGKIRGTVHAGVNGNKDCLITALGVSKVQVRIANIISCITDNKIIDQATHIYVYDDKLYISPLTK